MEDLAGNGRSGLKALGLPMRQACTGSEVSLSLIEQMFSSNVKLFFEKQLTPPLGWALS